MSSRQAAGLSVTGTAARRCRLFQKRYGETLPLSEQATEFVRKSLQKRWLGRAAVASFLILPLLVVDGFLREEVVRRDYVTLRREAPLAKPEAAKALAKGCRNLQLMPDWSHPVGERVFGICRTLEGQNLAWTSLRDARKLTQEQLTGTLLCKTKLSPNIKLDPNWNCEDLGITP